MDRLEKVRQNVDGILLNIQDACERRRGYVHLYGVSQFCAMIALKRKEDVELASIAGMLHDIYSYSHMDTENHAQKGAVMARALLDKMGMFMPEEIDKICAAIFNHSDKGNIHDSFCEVLIDGDVLQHYLYNPMAGIPDHENKRMEELRAELDL